jgi:hypothetical protein
MQLNEQNGDIEKIKVIRCKSYILKGKKTKTKKKNAQTNPKIFRERGAPDS